MATKIPSILPPNAIPAELALELTHAERFAGIPVPVRDVKDPDTCPAALLPWLAWEFGVDTWNTDWTEQEKRNAIKRAAYIHRHRGTAAAVKMSLEDSPFTSTIEEWFEQEPKGEPYTFALNVVQDGSPVTQMDLQDLKNAVLRAKNLRSWFSITMRGETQGNVILAGYMTGSERVTYTVPFSLAGIDVNGWTGEEFAPQTAFAGATYTLRAEGVGGSVVWRVEGPADVDNGRVTITGPGRITVSASTGQTELLTHTIDPALWFEQDGSTGMLSEFEAWCTGQGARVPLLSELTWGKPPDGDRAQRGHMGSLWSEWGDMASFGWPGAPEEGTTWAHIWQTLTVSSASRDDPEGWDSSARYYAVTLAGSSTGSNDNGRVTNVAGDNTNAFYRCCVRDIAQEETKKREAMQ